MRPKHLALILVLCIQAVQCTSAQQDEFPTLLTTEKHSDLVRIKGSRVFLRVPHGYQEMDGIPRLSKSDSQYLMVIESKGTSFMDKRSMLSRENMEAQGAKVGVHLTVVLNGMEGLYFEGPSKKPGETKLGLAFGNDSTYIMVVGVCETSDAVGKKELNAMMRTVFYDPTFPLDPFEFTNYEIDPGILGFKFATSVSNIIVYSPDGTVSDDTKATYMSTMSMPGMTTDEARGFAEDMLRRMKRKGITFDQETVMYTTINGYNALVHRSAISLDDAPGAYYQAVVTDGKSTVVLMAQAYDQQKDWMAKLDRTAASIVLKTSRH